MVKGLRKSKEYRKLADSFDGNCEQLSSTCGTIIAVVANDLVKARAKVAASIASGLFDQTELDEIDAEIAKAAPLLSAAQAYRG